IAGITAAGGWRNITPDTHGDWLGQRDTGFASFIAMGDKRAGEPKVFENFSLGVVTGRDAWCFNSSKERLQANITRMIAQYNRECAAFASKHGALPSRVRAEKVE